MPCGRCCSQGQGESGNLIASASRVNTKLFPPFPQSTRVISFQFSGVSSHHKLNWAAKSQGNRNGKGVGRRGRPSFGAYFKSRFCGLEAQALYQGAVCGDNNDSDEADESQDSEDGDENNDDDADADSVWP